MIDLNKISRKANIRNVKTIDAMIAAGNEYVTVDGYACKLGKKWKSDELEAKHLFHDKKSGCWFKGAGTSILNELVPQFKGHDEAEIDESYEKNPQLWRLSPVIKPEKGNQYRPTEFLGSAAKMALLEEEMEEKANDGSGQNPGAEGEHGTSVGQA